MHATGADRGTPSAPLKQCGMMGGKKIALRGGGGGDTEAHFPNPPPSLAAVTGGGGSGRGCPTCRAGGGGSNHTHVALIILTTQMWGGGLLGEKTFSGQILCSCAFGANIRSYTKQRAQHGTPFLQPPPPLLRRASMSSPPPPAEQFSGRHMPTAVARAWYQTGEVGDARLDRKGQRRLKLSGKRGGAGSAPTCGRELHVPTLGHTI